jgi:protein tyrosine phosphatase (PTP) superfamily phosphohydrolase (DUF442 family)
VKLQTTAAALLACTILSAQETSTAKVAELPESRPTSDCRYESLGDLPGVQKVTRFSERLYRGAQPQDVEGMLSLKKLGVTTIISVEDPDQPEIEAATKAGIKVMNVPTEYNGFPRPVVDDLVKKYRENDEVIYVHCHHGKHRGGAAASILRMTFEGVPQLEAVQELAELGCSKRYPGLYETVRQYRPNPAIAHRVLKPRPGIDGLIEVTPWVLRGTSALPAEAVAALKDLGVRAILSADITSEARDRARAAGIEVVTIPIADPASATEKQAAVRALAEKRREKVFLHANDDPAKVALMVAWFRLTQSQWTPDEAAREIEALVPGERGSDAARAIRGAP